MRQILLILVLIFLLGAKSYAQEVQNIELTQQKGVIEKKSKFFQSPYAEVKKTLSLHQRYSNNYDFDDLKNLYAENYVNADGLNKELFFDLIKKTWGSYPDIKYQMDIKDIEITGDLAIVQVSESAKATTVSQSDLIAQKGFLESKSSSVYYLNKINNKWLIIADYIIFEKTFLKYGSAKDINIDLSAPCQISANTQYTSSLSMEKPKDSLIIASLGQENITFPQTLSKEVFRKLPQSGPLERVFTSNNKNINEYAVASFGITKAEIHNVTEVKFYITGLGFIMSRVNVIPKNNFIKVEKK
jgi:hypothetical protein